MDKFTHTAADGTSIDYFPQSYTDAAVAAAIAAQTPVNTVAPEVTEVARAYRRLNPEVRQGVIIS